MNNSAPHILIIDDEPKNLQITAQILKEAGYSISLARDGMNAVTLMSQEIPDLILLDVMMPGMDGFEVCRRIKQMDTLREIPVIFFTALNQTADLVEGFKAGGIDYLIKPLNRDELLIRVKTHIDLSFSKKKLKETIWTRDKLYSIIAHDIRSPFSNIAMLIEVLNQEGIEPGNQEYTESMQMLKDSVGQTGILLDNLLEWTRLQVGSIALKPKVLSIAPVIRDCFQLLSGNARNKNIKLEFSAGDDIRAYFDEITIHTVFRNILSNAIKFTPEYGEISVTTENEGTVIAVSVKDTGIGMSREVQEKIFEQNESYSSQGTMHEKGSGLGLHLVKDMISQNKGTLRVESMEGAGTTIIVKLPRYA
jgi:two-component system, sensor histidine kinase and response regulator